MDKGQNIDSLSSFSLMHNREKSGGPELECGWRKGRKKSVLESVAGENNVSTSVETRIDVCIKRLKLSWVCSCAGPCIFLSSNLISESH